MQNDNKVFLLMEKCILVFCEELVEYLRVEEFFLHVLIHYESTLLLIMNKNNESRVRQQDSAQLCGKHTASHPSIMFYQRLSRCRHCLNNDICKCHYSPGGLLKVRQ